MPNLVNCFDQTFIIFTFIIEPNIRTGCNNDSFEAIQAFLLMLLVGVNPIFKFFLYFFFLNKTSSLSQCHLNNPIPFYTIDNAQNKHRTTAADGDRNKIHIDSILCSFGNYKTIYLLFLKLRGVSGRAV